MIDGHVIASHLKLKNADLPFLVNSLLTSPMFDSGITFGKQIRFYETDADTVLINIALSG